MTIHEHISHRYFPKIRTAIIASLVIMMAGCSSGGGGVAALLLQTSPVPAAPTATAATTLPAQSSPPTTVNQTASTTSDYAAIVQTASYTGGSGNPVTSITPKAADINATMAVTYGSSALPSSLTISSSGNVNGTVSQNQAIANYPSTTVPFSVYLDDNVVVGTYTTGGNVMQNDAIVIVSTPTSATTATAFNYQSFGIWEYSPNTSSGTESAFSYGVPTATMPTTGTASYAGIAFGAYVDPNGTTYATSAGMVSTADFGARTIGFGTFGTSTVNGTTGATATNNALNLSGMLTITDNNFTGAVTNSGGTMSGNATGLFYGPGISSPTTSSSAGSPAEMGGTYALTGKGGGMLGAFGGIAQ